MMREFTITVAGKVILFNVPDVDRVRIIKALFSEGHTTARAWMQKESK